MNNNKIIFNSFAAKHLHCDFAILEWRTSYIARSRTWTNTCVCFFHSVFPLRYQESHGLAAAWKLEYLFLFHYFRKSKQTFLKTFQSNWWAGYLTIVKSVTSNRNPRNKIHWFTWWVTLKRSIFFLSSSQTIWKTSRSGVVENRNKQKLFALLRYGKLCNINSTLWQETLHIAGKSSKKWFKSN